LPGGFLFVTAAGDGGCVEAHLVGELDCQVSQAAYPERRSRRCLTSSVF